MKTQFGFAKMASPAKNSHKEVRGIWNLIIKNQYQVKNNPWAIVTYCSNWSKILDGLLKVIFHNKEVAYTSPLSILMLCHPRCYVQHKDIHCWEERATGIGLPTLLYPRQLFSLPPHSPLLFGFIMETTQPSGGLFFLLILWWACC